MQKKHYTEGQWYVLFGKEVDENVSRVPEEGRNFRRGKGEDRKKEKPQRRRFGGRYNEMNLLGAVACEKEQQKS